MDNSTQDPNQPMPAGDTNMPANDQPTEPTATTNEPMTPPAGDQQPGQ